MNTFFSSTQNNKEVKLMKKKDQKIGCSVYDCKHCNCEEDSCKLKEIKVSNCKGSGEKETTMCDSYQQKKD